MRQALTSVDKNTKDLKCWQLGFGLLKTHESYSGHRSIIHASLGEGSGKSDKEFREQQIEIQVKEVSSFSPYNKIRITQHYQYELGVLRETVELLKEKNGSITPFMKMEEKAYFYLRGKLDKAPTIF